VGARVEGNLDCDGAALINRENYAFSIDGANISGGLFLKNGFINGEVRLVGATIGGNLDLDGGVIIHRTGDALSSDGSKIAGNVFLNNGFQADGQVKLIGATIGGDLNCDHGLIQASNALVCDGAKIAGSVFLNNGFRAVGQVKLIGATIGGDLSANGGQLLNREGYALSADKLKISGGVFLNNAFKGEGHVSFVGAMINGTLNCSNSTVVSGTGTALSCDGAKITGNFLGNGFKAEGEVRLVGAIIDGNLDFDSAVLINRKDKAFLVDRATIGGGVFLRDFKAEGAVHFATTSVTGYFYWRKVRSPEFTALDLRSAKMGTLADDERSWPGKGSVFLDGLTYDRIDDDSPTDADTRVKWLKLQGAGRFSPQPYEQLAAVLHKMGHDEEAVKVTIAKNQEHATHTLFLSQQWWWYNVFGPLIGYGYRPIYAFWFSVAVISLGCLVFWIGYRGRLIIPAKQEAAVQAIYSSHEFSKHYPKFHPIVYSLETFVPLLQLDMGKHWRPDATRKCHIRLGNFSIPFTGDLLRYYFWFHIIAGWVLTTLWLAGLTGLVKS
jgi:hypothetical protein